MSFVHTALSSLKFVKEREPALSIKINGEYFINNLNDQADFFTVNADGDYERTIDQTELTLSFDTESDCKYLIFNFYLGYRGAPHHSVTLGLGFIHIRV